jgi:hypothetical protein
MPARRFPPPWTVEELDACFVVVDHSGQKLAYIYFEEESGRRSAAQKAHPKNTERLHERAGPMSSKKQKLSSHGLSRHDRQIGLERRK